MSISYNAKAITTVPGALKSPQNANSRIFINFLSQFDPSLTNLWITFPSQGNLGNDIFSKPFDEILQKLMKKGTHLTDPVLISEYKQCLRLNFIVPNSESRSLNFKKDLENIKPSLTNCSFEVLGLACDKKVLCSNFFNFVLLDLVSLFLQERDSLLISILTTGANNAENPIGEAIQAKEQFAKNNLELFVFH